MLLDLPWRTSPILRTSSLRLAAVYSSNLGEGDFSQRLDFRFTEFSEVCSGRKLQEVVSSRAPLRGKNSRKGKSRPTSESMMNTTWWTRSFPGGNPPRRCAVQKSG